MGMRRIGLLLVVLVAACKGPEVSSRSPLTDDEIGVSDARMVGVWQVFDEKPPQESVGPPVGLVHLVRGDGAQLGVAMLESRDFGPRRTWVGAVSGQVAGRWYLSVQARGDDKALHTIEDFLVFRCDFENDDTVHVRQLGQQRVKAAIDRGELRGRALGKDRLRITSPTDQLAAWIAAQDPVDLFEPFILLRRVSLPVPIPENGESAPAARPRGTAR